MIWQETLALWLRQTSYAAAWCLGLLCVAERLAPGSVLPYVNFFPLVPFTVVLATGVPPPAKASAPMRALAFLPLVLALPVFLFTLTSDLGRLGILFPLAALGTGGVVLWLLAYPERPFTP